ncbi:hypothetical protein D3C76_1170220 [compost metagenome]
MFTGLKSLDRNFFVNVVRRGNHNRIHQIISQNGIQTWVSFITICHSQFHSIINDIVNTDHGNLLYRLNQLAMITAHSPVANNDYIISSVIHLNSPHNY